MQFALKMGQKGSISEPEAVISELEGVIEEQKGSISIPLGKVGEPRAPDGLGSVRKNV